MTPIQDALALILKHPAPVIILDTCNLLDLFRRDLKDNVPKSGPEELQAALALLRFVAVSPRYAYVVTPELVAGEFADHADRIENDFDAWFRPHDESREWFSRVSSLLGVTLPPPVSLQTQQFAAGCRKIADNLLTASIRLSRDQTCLDRALVRLVGKARSSHKKEIKDSMNLEQSLELSRRLRAAPLGFDCVFVSSNTSDFANPKSTRLHDDLVKDFRDAGLSYFPSLRAMVGRLQLIGQLV